jgi:uncharacterized membrane protein YkgB
MVETLNETFDRVDGRITAWMARYGIVLLRLTLGVVFLWFGILKFFPGLSPAEDLAARTISTLTFGIMGPEAAVLLLAI